MKQLIYCIIVISICYSSALMGQSKHLNALSQADRIDHATAVKNKLFRRSGESKIKKNITFNKPVKKVKTGWQKWHFIINGLDHETLVFIPLGYDPSKKHVVKILLHGAVSATVPGQELKWILNKSDSRFTDSINNVIEVYPKGWRASMWWNNSQVENIKNIVFRLKQKLNVDANKIFLIGFSDGARGCFYIGQHYIETFAGIIPILGSPDAAFSNRQKILDVKNSSHSNWLMVNTENDLIMPIEVQNNYANFYRNSGVPLRFHRIKKYGHELGWMEDFHPTIESFILNNSNNFLPKNVFWSTTTDLNHPSNLWIEILKAESQKKGPIDLMQKLKPISVSATFEENVFTIVSTKVRKIKILLSDEMVDFDKPIKVIVNGKTKFEKKLTPNKWEWLKYYERFPYNEMKITNSIEIKY